MRRWLSGRRFLARAVPRSESPRRLGHAGRRLQDFIDGRQFGIGINEPDYLLLDLCDAAFKDGNQGLDIGMNIGVDGVRIGTRFVASVEADMHPVYTNALIAANAKDSIYTLAFDGGAAFKVPIPHRVLWCAIDAVEAFEGETVGKIVPLDGKEMAVPRFSTRPPSRTSTGHVEAMCLYAGQGVGGVKGM